MADVNVANKTGAKSGGNAEKVVQENNRNKGTTVSEPKGKRTKISKTMTKISN